MSRNKFLYVIIAVAALSIAAALGWYAGASRTEPSADTPSDSGRKVLFWHDPMFPGTKFDKPGKSPFMDMELVPVYEDDAGAGGSVVTIRPEVINNLGVRTYKVERAAHARRVIATGYLVRTGTGDLQALVDIVDRDAGWVRAGLPAQVRVLDQPANRFEATVESARADVDVGARSLKATLRLKQADPALKPNMSVEVTIFAPPVGSQKLFVPREALIRTATRTAVVLALGEGRFQPAPVVVGEEYGDWIEILEGVKHGDVVVTSGQFLIDSEASLRASLQRMEAPK
jgi:membrane fusion protein, copper/silver efflux system